MFLHTPDPEAIHYVIWWRFTTHCKHHEYQCRDLTGFLKETVCLCKKTFNLAEGVKVSDASNITGFTHFQTRAPLFDSKLVPEARRSSWEQYTFVKTCYIDYYTGSRERENIFICMLSGEFSSMRLVLTHLFYQRVYFWIVMDLKLGSHERKRSMSKNK